RPSNAFDGDPGTAWRVGAFSDPRGERLRVDLGAPVDTDRLTLVQPLTGPRNRWLTAVTLRFDGGPPLPVALGAASRTAAGQQVVFPRRRFSRLEIEVRATSTGVRAAYTGQSGVGFAEVRVGGRRLEEVLRLPTDLLAAAGPDSARHRLLVQLTRDRADPAEPFKSDTEPAMSRELTLPTARDFTLTGTARVSAAAPDPVVDRTVGRPAGGMRADSSGRLPGSLAARAAGAFDGDPATLWSPGLGPQEGAWLSVTAPRPVTLSALDLSVVADGRHSVPTKLRLEVDGRPVRTLDLPPLPDVAVDDGTRPVRLAFPPVRGSRLRLVVEAVREVRTRDSISERPIALPVAFAEVGAAGLRVPPAPSQVPSPCRADLLTVDGRPVGVRVAGSGAAAASRQGLRLSGCGAALRLGPGPHVVRTTPGRVSGLDVDRLLLASAAGGSAAPAAGPVGSAAPAGRVLGAPRVSVRSQGRTSYALRVSGARPGQPFWLMLGQSLSRGWTGRAGGRPLGAPTLVDGYANGWLLTPAAASFDVTLTWTPQRRVRVALGLSAVGLLACLVLAVGPPRRRRVPSAVAADPPPEIDPPLAVTGGRPPPRVVVASALSVTAVAAFLVHPAAGALVGLLTLAALLLPRGRLLLRVGSAGCLAVSAAYVLDLQARYRLPSDGDWVAAFHKVATVSWLAVALLAADVVVAWARRRSPPPAASHPAASHRPGDGRPGR
ncbi:MAG TPA: discoidin domain-containing protein, partial [Frankiaceae bacterium]|nr:discoidin domain-containing protein [Frankiaceae bacterium]